MPSSPSSAETATPAAAILLVIAAGCLFSLLDASAKYLVVGGMSAPFVTWVRFAVHVLLVLIFFRAWSERDMFRVRSLPMQLLRGVFLFGSTIFNFLALTTLQLADAIAIYFFAPMVITALAGPMLGEWAGWRRWAAISVGFVGILIVVRPGFASFDIGHLYAVMSVFSYCFYVIMTRRMGASETASSLIFYSALAPVVFMSPAVPLAGSLPPDLLFWFLLLSLGVYGAAGHFLLIKAYKIGSAPSLAPYAYLQMVWATGIGFLVFDDLPDRYTIIGAGIIVASGLYIVNRERRLRLGNASVPTGETRELAKKL